MNDIEKLYDLHDRLLSLSSSLALLQFLDRDMFDSSKENFAEDVSTLLSGVIEISKQSRIKIRDILDVLQV